MVREIIVDYEIPGASNALSVFFFDEAQPLGAQRTALEVLFNGIESILSNTMEWSVRQVGRELQTTTGALLGEWTTSVPASGQGTAMAAAAANATSMLLRWSTNTIVAGRFLRGRTFIPGLGGNRIEEGGLNPADQVTLASAGEDMIGEAAGFGIWHRPTNGVGGVFHEAVGAAAWNELAVQRRRR